MPAKTVNGLEEARSALRAVVSGQGSGVSVELRSPPYAACHAGVNYYRALLDQLRTEFPETPFTFTLCCGNDPAIAHDALRMGFASVRCECSEGMLAQLQAIAAGLGAVICKNEEMTKNTSPWGEVNSPLRELGEGPASPFQPLTQNP